jgi:ATP-binding cassette subfamily F protein 3
MGAFRYNCSMISIQFSAVRLMLGAHTIFAGLSWEVQHDQKIGLVGPNGAGKSSLLKCIIGEYSPEPGGTITRARGVTIGYLPQHYITEIGKTAHQSAIEGRPRVAILHAELELVEHSLADPRVYGNEKALTHALGRQQTLFAEYQALGGDQYPQHVETLLHGLGLAQEDWHKPLEVLSGGQKKLVGLARLLLLKPDVLLLDEPDNHLDLAGKQYLEGLIQAYPGAVVLISHDRYLLDACVTHIAEIEDGRITPFSGDYSAYLFDKQLRQARQGELFRVQQKQISHIEAAIKRFSLWAKLYDNQKFAKRAQSTQKMLDKMERIEKPITERRRMELRLSGWRGSSKVLEFKAVSKDFGPRRQVVNDLDLLIHHGERVGVIGANGTGKSVLLKLALGLTQPDRGEVILGPSIRTGYYSQEQETLNPHQTLLDVVRRAGTMSESQGVAFLNRYLFPYRMVTQKVGELSGGERSRMQLALIVLSGANFLVLDEPTNNLDIPSIEVLENALEEFEGSVLVVSHDRYFLDQVVDRILAFDDGQITTHPGGYSDYLAKKS